MTKADKSLEMWTQCRRCGDWLEITEHHHCPARFDLSIGEVTVILLLAAIATILAIYSLIRWLA